MAGYLSIANKRRMRQAAEDLGLHTMAARGDPRTIKKQLKVWMK
ncbi:MAG: hypothetical protein JWM84_4034 [Nocardioides sp.]|nr:hypothetical protein [Nocardioides sp.]